MEREETGDLCGFVRLNFNNKAGFSRITTLRNNPRLVQFRVIKGRDRSKPLFLHMAFNGPHAPLEAPKALLDKYANLRDKDPKRRSYAAMVDAFDMTIGKVLATLDEEGMRENTLVLFFSDNGGPIDFGARNAPLRNGKGTTFEGGTRVPAVVRWPGHVKAGARLNQSMSALDVFPTVAGAVGVKLRNTLPLDGKNMWPAITRGRIEPREDLLLAVDSGQKTYYCVHMTSGNWFERGPRTICSVRGKTRAKLMIWRGSIPKSSRTW